MDKKTNPNISIRGEWRILQIIPARDGHVAVYMADEVLKFQLACLALIEDESGKIFITGIDDEMGFCEDVESFLNYQILESKNEEGGSMA